MICILFLIPLLRILGKDAKKKPCTAGRPVTPAAGVSQDATHLGAQEELTKKYLLFTPVRGGM